MAPTCWLLPTCSASSTYHCTSRNPYRWVSTDTQSLLMCVLPTRGPQVLQSSTSCLSWVVIMRPEKEASDLPQSEKTMSSLKQATEEQRVAVSEKYPPIHGSTSSQVVPDPQSRPILLENLSSSFSIARTPWLLTQHFSFSHGEGTWL